MTAPDSRVHPTSLEQSNPQFPVVFSTRPHPIPSRTRKLSLSEPMVLQGKPCGRVGRCRDYSPQKARRHCVRAFCFLSAARGPPGPQPRGTPRGLDAPASGPFVVCGYARWQRAALGRPSSCALPAPAPAPEQRRAPAVARALPVGDRVWRC